MQIPNPLDTYADDMFSIQTMADGEFHITFNSVDIELYYPDCFTPPGTGTGTVGDPMIPVAPDLTNLDGTQA